MVINIFLYCIITYINITKSCKERTENILKTFFVEHILKIMLKKS